MLSNAMYGEVELHHEVVAVPGSDYKLAHLCLECCHAEAHTWERITMAPADDARLDCSVDRELKTLRGTPALPSRSPIRLLGKPNTLPHHMQKQDQ